MERRPATQGVPPRRDGRYSIIGSVLSTTTCKPCATAATGSTQLADAAAARGPIAQRLVPA
jgi:hypothetical protein